MGESLTFAPPPSPEALDERFADKAPLSSQLKPVAVQGANYTAAPGDYVPVDTTLGVINITLPNNPADGTVIAVKRVVGAVNNVTVTCSGADVLNVAGGATVSTLSLLNMHQTFVFKSGTKIWYVETSVSKGGLDAAYSPIATKNAQVPQVVVWTGGVTRATAATSGLWVDLDTNGNANARPTDFVIAGVTAGQWIRVNITHGLWGAESSLPSLTLFSYKAGVQTRNMSDGTVGVTQWNSVASLAKNISGAITFQIEAGDIEAGGTVRLRWCFRQGSATAKTFYIGSGGQFFRAEAFGPF